MKKIILLITVSILFSGCGRFMYGNYNRNDNGTYQVEPGIFPGIRSDVYILKESFTQYDPPEDYQVNKIVYPVGYISGILIGSALMAPSVPIDLAYDILGLPIDKRAAQKDTLKPINHEK
ncbi:MAG: hypothetical protein KJ915_08145 [Candidatus Omnitrophica bacterium]|nr:hypothetical protein [Candidatus Omnitrophota bacterium]